MHISEVKSVPAFFQFSTQNLRLNLQDACNALGYTVLLLVVYAGLYLCIGDPFLPGKDGSAWAIVIIWIGGHVGAFLAELINVPSPVGMICAGIFLANVGDAVLIKGLKASWSTEIRGAALAIIFLRSGLELDIRVFKRIGLPAVKLLFIPGLIEAFVDGGLAVALFSMPPLFGFSLGFILKAIGPALVIQLMFEVMARGLGLAKEMPTIVVAAASFDDMVAITGYTIFINIAVQGTSNQAWHIAQGPLSVVFGAMLGLVAAFICSGTIIWNTKYKRVGVLVLGALAMKYFFDKFDFESGGALAALTLGLTVKELWRRQWPRCLSKKNDEPDENIRQAEKAVRILWRYILMPLLFTLIGAKITFSTLPVTTIQKACALIFAGLGVRMLMTFLVMLTSRYTVLESIWFAIAWTPKATVQAALGGLPMDAVNRAYPIGTPKHTQYAGYAQDALTTAVFEIIISGTLGSLMVRWLSPLLLKRDPESVVERAPSTKHVKSSEMPHRSEAVEVPGGGGARLDALDERTNLVGDHVQRLEQLAGAMIATGDRDDEEEARLYGQRLKAGVRALTSRVRYEIDPKDIIGADAYREAVRELNRRTRLQGASSSTLNLDNGSHSGPVMGQPMRRRGTATGDVELERGSSSIEIVEHVARTA